MASDHNGFRGQLRDFISEHREGWSHHEWLELLAQLSDGGLDTSDPEGIGTALEQERVLAFLEGLGLKGLGPKRREALAGHFRRMWDLERASVEDIAEVPSFHKGLAEAIHEALR
ncbi:MAG: helix-hairpin-helix domain-containing protein [Longimicrobiales bacterium]|nr:helix-hairpin-helix domain-containing protein [Longimicrobiales bacterium]